MALKGGEFRVFSGFLWDWVVWGGFWANRGGIMWLAWARGMFFVEGWELKRVFGACNCLEITLNGFLERGWFFREIWGCLFKKLV